MKGIIFQDVMPSSVLKFIDVSEIYIASIFKVDEQSKQAENRANNPPSPAVPLLSNPPLILPAAYTFPLIRSRYKKQKFCKTNLQEFKIQNYATTKIEINNRFHVCKCCFLELNNWFVVILLRPATNAELVLRFHSALHTSHSAFPN
jgi:hypothetical protein